MKEEERCSFLLCFIFHYMKYSLSIKLCIRMMFECTANFVVHQNIATILTRWKKRYLTWLIILEAYIAFVMTSDKNLLKT